MKSFLAIISLAAVAAVASAGNTGYGAPAEQQETYQPQVFRHVYVHSAPDEQPEQNSRTIRVPGGDKHVNIVFVRTPAQSSSQQTEVILPEQDEHKNLVYVLLKKGENSADVRVTRPAARAPEKPSVYFIKYNNGGGGAGGAGGNGGGSSGGGGGGSGFGGSLGGGSGIGGGSGATPVRTPSSAYGAF